MGARLAFLLPSPARCSGYLLEGPLSCDVLTLILCPLPGSLGTPGPMFPWSLGPGFPSGHGDLRPACQSVSVQARGPVICQSMGI